jgi:hypothetical protein
MEDSKRFFKAVWDGIVLAFWAHVVAWLTFWSAENLGHLVGHIVAVIGIKFLGTWL